MACKTVKFKTRRGKNVSFKSCGHKARGRKAAHKPPGRKWKTVAGIPIYKDSDYGEYIVAVTPRESTWYYTDDADDAVGTARAEGKRSGRSAGRCRTVSFKAKGKRVNFRACR